MLNNIDELIEYAEENQYWKIDNVILDSFEHKGKEFKATYYISTDQGEFEFPVFAKFPEEIKFDEKVAELWKMACAVQLANLFIFSKQKEIDLSFLSKRGELFIRDMISQSTTHLEKMFPGHFAHKKREWVEYQEFNPANYKIDMDNKFSVMMSGGKESTGIYSMYHNLGKRKNESLFGIFIDFVGKIKRRENNKMIRSMEEINHTPVIIESNIIDPLLFISTKWGTNNLFLNIITFEAAMFCYSKGIDYFNLGNEFDCTVANIIDGRESFGQNYDQSTVNERKVTQFLQDINVNVKLFSPIYNLSETACQALFSWNDNLRLSSAQNSCVKPVEIFNDAEVGQKKYHYIACNKCDKCMRIAAIQTALGLDCKLQGLTYRKKVWNMKEDIFNSLDSTKETQTLAYLLDRKGKFPSSKSIIKPQFNFVSLDFEYDKYHPFILPPRIYEYIHRTLKQVRRDLNVK